MVSLRERNRERRLERVASASQNSLGELSRLAVVSCYYNPGHCEWQRYNAIRFLEKISAPTFIVELSYDDEFLFRDSLKIHGNSETQLLWQKERLLNIAERMVPPEFDAIAWVDADVLFADPHWPTKTLAVLEKNHVCQPWSDCIEIHPTRDPEIVKPSICHAYTTGIRDFANLGIFHPGFAWAMRRDTWRAIGGLDENNIVGNGDTQMVRGFFNRPFWTDQFYSRRWLACANDWMSRCHSVVNCRVGCVHGTISHLWHGDRTHRRYVERLGFLGLNDYDPATDIATGENGILEFTAVGLSKTRMIEQIRGYFHERRQFSVHERLGDRALEDVARAFEALNRQASCRA